MIRRTRRDRVFRSGGGGVRVKVDLEEQVASSYRSRVHVRISSSVAWGALTVIVELVNSVVGQGESRGCWRMH